jgi:PncC family amidohydrolase
MAALEEEIARLIRQNLVKTGKVLTIGSVESATGGKIADKITTVPGSSDYYKGSIISYSDEIKNLIAGVKEETIKTHGAVSQETALEMAQGGRKILKVDICLSDTGIAGPAGATPEKPVGLFYIGLAAHDTNFTRKHIFEGSRDENKKYATEAALTVLKEYLQTLLNK